MTKTIQIKISGKVQGVGFRFESYQQFVDLSLTGKAENSADGGVEITATGEDENLEKLVAWAHNGPVGAHVTNVEAKEVAQAPETQKES